ncbi:MAG TPA: ATP-binding cassette domain-containing protein [Bacilli bacterium]|nr:ATP-binding cassette domain-containing protein [Bacilli bacterium]
MGIVIKNLLYKYGQYKAINNISLEMDNNEIYGLLGKNGSGKTTLLELIAGLLKPTNGSIKIDKIDSKRKLRKEIGIVFQFPEEQFFEKTVKKEIEFALNNFNLKKSKTLDALNLMGLSKEYLNKNIDELSNGEKRMIAIASVLVYNPEIILLDEPTIGLDYKNKQKLIRLIKKLKNEYHKTIIIVSHDSNLLYEICDELIVIDKGELILYGDPDSVYKEEKLLKKYDIDIPKVLQFEKLVKDKKNIKLMHTTNINDLIKEVYRNV